MLASCKSGLRSLTVAEGLAEIGADVISGGTVVSGRRRCLQMSHTSRFSSGMVGLMFIAVKKRDLLMSTLQLNIYHLEEEVCWLGAEGDQSRELSSLEASDMDGEVVFCGVRLPRKRIVEGFWQRRLKSNRIVDLTEDGEMVSDVAPDPGSNNDPNQSQNGDPNRSQNEDSVESAQQDVAPTTVPADKAAGTPKAQRANSALGTPNSARTSTQPQRTQSSQDTPVSAGHAGADSQTTSNGVTSCPQNDHRLAATAVPPGSTPSSAEDDWRSRLPPLPTVPRPAELSPAVAGSQPPQQVTLTVARIKNPKGIGALWTLEKPDPKAAPVSRYHIYALQEALDGRFSAWRNVGTVRAMALPMACKLTDHGPGRRFCIAVVSEDIFGRFGPYSQIQAIGPPE
ncbi:hypothetical protein GJAV_G00217320 [Gymnothorax javanicus]|nr:hypothetical protein GJAV_G00217320 [Gymnothorax javanicus]